MSRFKLIYDYLLNRRIKEYRALVRFALTRGYTIISLRDYVENKYSNNVKLLILRHDVDHCSSGTQMMFQVEKEYGVHASYYFRNSTIEPCLMREIETYGSEASLHFESIADFAKAHPDIKITEDLFARDFYKPCLKSLKADLERIRALIGVPCLTIASHGERENALLKTPNNYLTEDESVYTYLGIRLEAYNKKFLDQVSCYISDVPIEYNGGYRYGTTPFEAIRRSNSIILLLTHPNHWHYALWPQCRKIIKVFLFGPQTGKETFRRI